MLMKIEKDSKFNTNFVQVELYVIVYILVFDFYISENSFSSLKKLEIEIAQGFEEERKILIIQRLENYLAICKEILSFCILEERIIDLKKYMKIIN